MKVLKFFFGFIILCLFTMFAVANSHTVGMNYLFKPAAGEAAPIQMPMFLFVYMCFGAGFICAWILNLGLRQNTRKTIKKLNQQLKMQTEELNKLRNLPLAPVEKGDKKSAENAG